MVSSTRGGGRWIRMALMGLMISSSGVATAADRIFFRNMSRAPVRVSVVDRGRWRGTEVVFPGQRERLRSGDGRTRLVINGRSFRVRDLGFRTRDNSWVVTWRGSGRNFTPPPPPRQPAWRNR